ncbi:MULTISPECIES: type VII secretion protein EccB [Mycobacterium avium complex (MAC)]|uniref:ESX-5 secretion system ATPase EccB5 n=15 Tax=Mycobacterium TaxID=1763 RepID=A0A2U2E5J3_MYCAV|nr:MULTISPECIES: type VII secretion protein EccB [Mycobacterium avium complex (MAC)]ETA92130.1 secretion protein EccB [Mycobacterium avium 05-4293]ETB09224.1 secretion protein EccB [Mycobacterium avium subsp. silvaticum ATCC 49884]ETB11372.1 secretion protein EccB [Mycobacterium avium subsp. paratuberculosis 08-8281]ETB16247.1 secretion protein EccB [Mycobacterium avium subsp. avium 10-9275]ETB20723.1 secretion protein EccB [Mycobacterium avium subsp. avium 11-4751]ETB24726.1 secretion protei
MAEESRGQRGSGYGLGLSTRTQVTGYQFLARRTAMALTRWRVRMEVEPGRRQNLAVVASVSAALVICLGALLWSFISPAGQVGDSPIIADRDSGALYVRVGDRLYPALNLASARLITGRPDNPHLVKSNQIASLPRGPMVGIPGAPSNFHPTGPSTSSWLVCDTVSNSTGAGAPSGVTVTVIDGAPDLSNHRKVLTGSDAVVLNYGGDAWVIRDGRRSRIDATNRSVLLPLGLTPEQVSMAKPMSRALYDALPVGPELTVPQIQNAGGAASFPGAPGPIGTVLVTPQISGPQQYSLVLADGVQTLPPLVAQILQNAGPGNTKPVTVEPSALAKMPVVNKLDLSSYPDAPLNVMDIRENPATCWWWQKTSGENRARVQVVSGATIPVAQKDVNKVVSLVKADTTGREADQVFFGPDYANFVAVTGNDPGAKTTESLWWLTDAGARFGVDDTRDVREALGLKTKPSVAPWVALRLLPQGPTLSRADALVQHDTLPMDMSPAELAVPK